MEQVCRVCRITNILVGGHSIRSHPRLPSPLLEEINEDSDDQGEEAAVTYEVAVPARSSLHKQLLGAGKQEKSNKRESRSYKL